MKTPKSKCKCSDATCDYCLRRQIRAGRELNALTKATRARIDAQLYGMTGDEAEAAGRRAYQEATRGK